MTVSIGVATAIPAAADGYCPLSGNVCMWEHPGYNGDRWVDVPGRPGGVEIDWWNGDHEISSIDNASGYYLRVQPGDLDGGGAWWGYGNLCVKPHQRISDLTFSDVGDYNDVPRSFIITSTPC